MTAFPSRTLVLLAALLLAACAGSSTDESLSAAAAVPATAEPVAAAPATPPPPRPAYQGRGMVTPPPPSPPAVAQAPVMTIEKARGECWMQLDRDKKSVRDLEKRAKLVEACAEAKMNAPPPQ